MEQSRNPVDDQRASHEQETLLQLSSVCRAEASLSMDCKAATVALLHAAAGGLDHSFLCTGGGITDAMIFRARLISPS